MKKEKKLRIFIDGGSRGNPGHGACAAVLIDEAGEIVFEEGKFLGRCSNDFAEYSGLRLALAAAARMGGQELEIFTDSDPLVRRFAGAYRGKDAGLAALMAEVREALEPFRKISLSRVPREKNKEADRLVSQLLDNARHAPPALDKSLAAENAAAGKKAPRRGRAH